MKTDIVLKIGVVFILIAVLTFAGYKRQSDLNKISIEENTEMVIFQPEGQMITQSTATDIKSDTSNDSLAKNTDSGPYAYVNNPCQKAGFSYICLAEFYKNMVKKYGAVTAIDDIKKRSSKDAGVLSVCHPIMHVIGRQAAQSYEKISEAFMHGDSFCWSGYHHGIMEGMIAKIGRENLPKELKNICSDIPGKEQYTFDYYNCVHGVGHGVMAEYDDEVLISLKLCDNLDGGWEKQSCYGGVFMQNIIDSTNVADTGNVVKYLKPEEPMYPCTIVEEKYKGQCYLGQTSYALQVTNYNWKKVFNMCAELENPYRSICNQSMGRDIANQAGHKAEPTEEKCQLPENLNDTKNCIIGSVKEIISYYHSDKEALYFCSILDTDMKNICTDTATIYYKQF